MKTKHHTLTWRISNITAELINLSYSVVKAVWHQLYKVTQPYYSHILNIISLLFTFPDIYYSLCTGIMDFSHNNVSCFKVLDKLPHFQPQELHFFHEEYFQKSPCFLTLDDELLHK